MKRLLISAVFILAVGGLFAQNTFKIGLVAGIPTDDASDVSKVALGADALYLFGKRNALISIGPGLGYRNFQGDEISPGFEAEDAQFVPISLAGRVSFLGIVRAGLDAGYAIGVSDFLDGGVYGRVLLGFGILRFFELDLSYEAIYDDATWGNLQIGLLLVL